MSSACQSVVERVLRHANNQPTLTEAELEIWLARRTADAKQAREFLLNEAKTEALKYCK